MLPMHSFDPPLSRNQRAQLRALTDQWIARAEALWGRRLAPVEVRFDLTGAAAGQYRPHPSPCIRYNGMLAALQFEAFCRHTPAHEVAHHVVARLHGPGRTRPHGAEWRAVMQAFGLEPRRCHDYDLGSMPLRRQRRFRYRCACREHELSATRHNRVLRGERRYLCRACGELLRPEG